MTTVGEDLKVNEKHAKIQLVDGQSPVAIIVYCVEDSLRCVRDRAVAPATEDPDWLLVAMPPRAHTQCRNLKRRSQLK